MNITRPDPAQQLRIAPTMDLPTPSPGFSRRKLIAGGLALGVAPLLPRFMGTAGAAPQAFGFPEPDMTSQVVRRIQFPVDGVVSWTDTYGACRDGCSRRHEGQDLLGYKLEKLVACVDGTVVGLKYDTSGNSLYLQDSEGWHYGYLHINNDDPGTDDGHNLRQWAFAPDIVVGAKVRKGQFIAYMGDSGNAEATTPHCHFEIRKPADAWYHGQAVNAKYSLDAATYGGTSVVVPASTFSPWSTSAGFITQQYLDVLNRRPQSAELALWTSQLDSGAKRPADLVESIIRQPGSDDVLAPLIRLYRGFFSRLPDTAGLMSWNTQIRGGVSLDQIAEGFSHSAEFRSRYGALDDVHYVDRAYRNVGAGPDATDHAYWTKRLASGLSRGRLMRAFVETARFRQVTYFEGGICLIYAGMLRRAPTAAGYDYWRRRMNSGTPHETLISTIQASAPYRQRFPNPA